MPTAPFLCKPPAGTPLNLSHPHVRGMVGCYDFLDLGGQVAKDTLGRLGDGTFNNGPKIKNLQGGHVLDLAAASSQSVTIPFNSRVPLTAPSNASTALLAVSFRFRMNALSGFQGLVTSQTGNDANALWDMYVDSSGNLAVGAFGTIPGVAVLAANTWYHIALFFDYNNTATNLDFKVYLNGVSVRSVSTGSNSLTTNPIRIGTRGDGFTKLDGQVDFVRVWERGLSVAEIREEWQNPWAIYRRPPRHSFASGAAAYAESFQIDNQIGAACAGLLRLPASMQLDATLTKSAAGLVQALAAFQLDSQVDSTIVGSKGQSAALQVDALLDSLADAIKGSADQLSFGVILDAINDSQFSAVAALNLGVTGDIAYTTLQRAVAALALDIVGEFLFSGAQDFGQTLGFAIQIATMAAVSQNRTQPLSFDTSVTCEPRGGFLYSKSFDLGAVVDVIDPLIVGFLYAEVILAGAVLESAVEFGAVNYAGILNLALSNSLAMVPQFAATGFMTLGIGAGFTQSTKVAGNNSLTLAVSVELAAVGGFLFQEALTLAAAYDVTLSGAMHAVATMALAMAAGVDLRPLTNFQDSLLIINHLETAFRSNAALNATLALGLEVEADPAGSKGGIVIMDAISMALGIAMAFEKVNRGPGGFHGSEPGTPGIFRPNSDTDDVPGIFKDPGAAGVPGIFKPTEG